MRSRLLVTVLGLMTLFVSPNSYIASARADEFVKAKKVATEDLPQGAIARFGSTRLQHGRDVTALMFARDGKRLFAAGKDFAVRVWDVETGKELRCYDNYACQMRDAALAPNEEMFAVVTHNIGVLIREIGSGEIYQRISEGLGTPNAVAFAPDGKTLFISGRFGLKWWDVETKKERDGLDAAKRAPIALAVSPAGRFMAATSGGPLVQLWDWKTGKSTRELTADDEAEPKLKCVAISKDGRYIAATINSSVGKTYVWDLEAKQDKSIITLAKPEREERLFCVAFSTDGETLFTGGSELTAWDWRERKVRYELTGHHSPVGSIAVSPDGKILASGGIQYNDIRSFAIRLWDVESGKEIVRHPHPARGPLTGLTVSGDGKRLVTTGADGRATVWDTATKKPVCNIHRPDAYTQFRAAFSPDGKLFATDAETQVTLWDAATGRATSQLKAGEERKRCVSFSPDSKYLAAGGMSGSIFIWDVERRALARTFRADDSDIWSIEYSPDGETLLVANDRGVARLWSAATGKPLLERKDHSWLLRDMTFSSDGMRVVGVSDDKVVVVWEVATGEIVHKFQTDWVMSSVSFCDHDRVVAVGRADDWLDFYDLATGKRFHRHKNRPGVAIGAISPSPDGRTLYTANSDSTVLQWDLAAILAKLPKLASAPTADELTRLWQQLESRDPVIANRSIWKLVTGADAAVKLLNEKLAPPKTRKPAPEKIERLIRELDADRFAVREQAFADLAKIGSAALPQLEKSLQETESIEVRFRLRTLVTRARGAGAITGWTTKQLQAARARQVLKYLDTPAARKLLARIEVR